MKRTVKKNFRLSEELAKAIAVRASELGVSWSDVVNQVLFEYFSEKKELPLTNLVSNNKVSINKVSTDSVSTNLVHTLYKRKKEKEIELPNNSNESYQQPDVFIPSQVKQAMPYGDRFAQIWSAWLGVNRDKGTPLISSIQLAQIKKIVETCGSDELKALDLISFSIENNYKGLCYDRFTGTGKAVGSGFKGISQSDFEQMVSNLSRQSGIKPD
jgi:antitoxin component of RelBE/YafQ-DinJ toxin-antitoxin module